MPSLSHLIHFEEYHKKKILGILDQLHQKDRTNPRQLSLQNNYSISIEILFVGVTTKLEFVDLQ